MPTVVGNGSDVLRAWLQATRNVGRAAPPPYGAATPQRP
ncbi:hypothetical protein J2847_005871 [Azospirillum agricola]|nr:hypothetical protein [Azospirillum agricola]